MGVVIAAGTTIAFKYKSSEIQRNDVIQQQHKAPNGYVSVERSGGGI